MINKLSRIINDKCLITMFSHLHTTIVNFHSTMYADPCCECKCNFNHYGFSWMQVKLSLCFTAPYPTKKSFIKVSTKCMGEQQEN